MTSLSQKTKQRDRLFHDKYEYSVDFYLPSASILRGATSGKIKYEEIPERFRKRQELMRTRLFNKTWPTDFDDLGNIVHLQRAFQMLIELEDVKIAVHGASITIFTNDLTVISKIEELHSHMDDLRAVRDPIILTHCVVDRPRNTIKKKQSDYKYRLMLRHVICPAHLKDGMQRFVETYKDHINVSMSLAGYLEKNWWKGSATESHFFIEFNDPKLKTMFELAAPRAAGKLYEIIVDK